MRKESLHHADLVRNNAVLEDVLCHKRPILMPAETKYVLQSALDEVREQENGEVLQQACEDPAAKTVSREGSWAAVLADFEHDELDGLWDHQLHDSLYDVVCVLGIYGSTHILAESSGNSNATAIVRVIEY